MCNHSTALVIGAGMAGLKTAIDLTAAGVPVQVLEARDRLGGRLLSEKSPSGLTLDIGASWFHDCLTNPLFKKYYQKLNKGKKLEADYDDYGMDYYDANGHLDTTTTSMNATLNELFIYLKLVTSNLPKEQDLSMKQACLDYLQEKKYAMTDDQLRYTHLLARYMECWFGSSWENISARAFAGEHAGRDLLCLNGYATVYDGEMEELLSLTHKKSADELLIANDSGVQFYLGTEVCGIAKNYQTGNIEVTTKSKGVFTCDYLVVTTPLTVLKLTDPKEIGCITWTPPLPPQIRTALDSFSPGNLGKLFLEFDEQFWGDTARYMVLPDEDLAFKDALLNNKPLTKEALSSLGVDLGKGQNPTPVLIINVTSLLKRKYGSVQRPLLICLTSEHLTEKLELCYRNGDLGGILKLINPSLSRVSDVPVNKIPTPSFVRMTEWTFDPYSRGSYTGAPVGKESDASEILEILTHPRGIFGESGVSRVRFAGEGIIDEGEGCVHGAWLSAQREAKVIVKLVNKAKL